MISRRIRFTSSSHNTTGPRDGSVERRLSVVTTTLSNRQATLDGCERPAESQRLPVSHASCEACGGHDRSDPSLEATNQHHGARVCATFSLPGRRFDHLWRNGGTALTGSPDTRVREGPLAWRVPKTYVLFDDRRCQKKDGTGAPFWHLNVRARLASLERQAVLCEHERGSQAHD